MAPPTPFGSAAVHSTDLAPIPPHLRTTTALDLNNLWIGMVVSVPTFYVAFSFVDLGMSWQQGILTIVAANAILLIPLSLSSLPGARTGLPFPLLLRAAFGIRGAAIPAVLRFLVAAGWCSVESFIGGQALLLLLPPHLRVFGIVPFLSTSLSEIIAFLLFTVLQLAILFHGMPAVHSLGRYSAPALIVPVLALFAWAYRSAGGLGPILSQPSRLNPAQFWPVFISSFSACVASWASVALNISDFTRFAKSPYDAILGHFGLPLITGLYCFLGLAIASATQVIFGRAIPNPINLVGEIIDGGGGGGLVTVFAVAAIELATITTNIPANFVAPANVFASLSPSKPAFTKGVVVTAVASIFFQPWKIVSSGENFIYVWLNGSGVMLGSIMGIYLTDYYAVRFAEIDVVGLSDESPLGPYYYERGFNAVALVAMGLSIAPLLPGFLEELGVLQGIPMAWKVIYDGSCFVGFLSASMMYWAFSFLARRRRNDNSSILHHPLRSAEL